MRQATRTQPESERIFPVFFTAGLTWSVLVFLGLTSIGVTLLTSTLLSSFVYTLGVAASLVVHLDTDPYT
ncbi:hypothetical protein [Dermatophilus congolensis]|uniref:hypothetical protein n=1 Tax=Dermatophilus congolensis TaxID=1863 RepID=UPI001AAF1DA4|nr:hypothetical protein [Dermatophilus congolensis]MBO3143656.1 hypothetical protein [Dermatophilus congolensis]MBO3152648.1 hypothetical protein [Dermatophilus congolensis]MBO3160341.1 hypothetical protein [Dermatophilus congolensis]MBO3163932.1 hypothetical protein [Dermatophilus congolensis]MBO3177478.1 hypothetical protein [Dermatophilus congolensis]